MMVAERTRYGTPLATLLPGVLPEAVGEIPITDLADDSRRVTEGALFCARRGPSGHGAHFIDQAVAHGAVVILAEIDAEWDAARIQQEAARLPVPLVGITDLGPQLSAMAGRFFDQPSESLPVVGITGTNGKTSCAWFLSHLGHHGQRAAMIGTLGSGLPGSVRPGNLTTPGAIEVQRELAALRQREAGMVAMEVSSHALSQHRVDGVQFQSALFTQLGRDHLDYHTTMESYGEAKARLFHLPGLKQAVINLDDPFGRSLLDTLPSGVERIGYSSAPPSAIRPDTRHLWAEGCRADDAGLTFTLAGEWGSHPVHLPLPGHFNITNLLGVLGVLLGLGNRVAPLIAGIARMAPVPGRMQPFGGGAAPLVVVDFAHTADALEQALRSLRGHTRGRLICLFGCGGDRDRGKRPLMGEIAERLADQVVLTDDNPRHEPGSQIIAEIKGGLHHPERAVVMHNRAQAIHQTIGAADAGDVILVAGKGHETTQQIGDLKHPLSDAEEVRSALGTETPGERP